MQVRLAHTAPVPRSVAFLDARSRLSLWWMDVMIPGLRQIGCYVAITKRPPGWHQSGLFGGDLGDVGTVPLGAAEVPCRFPRRLDSAATGSAARLMMAKSGKTARERRGRPELTACLPTK